MTVRRFVVCALEWLCGVLDSIPGPVHDDEGRWVWVRYSCYGCYPLRLASRAMDLDERWGTDVWSRDQR